MIITFGHCIMKAKMLEENIESTKRERLYSLEVELELKRRLTQLTDHLIKKQTQVEALSSEKATLSLRIEDSQREHSPFLELQKKLGVSISSSKGNIKLVEESEDKELLDLSSRLAGESLSTTGDQFVHIQALREHWKKCTANSIQLRELGPLLRDYQCVIVQHHVKNIGSNLSVASLNIGQQQAHRFFHLKSSSQLRMDDVPKLLSEYQQAIERVPTANLKLKLKKCVYSCELYSGFTSSGSRSLYYSSHDTHILILKCMDCGKGKLIRSRKWHSTNLLHSSKCKTKDSLQEICKDNKKYEIIWYY